MIPLGKGGPGGKGKFRVQTYTPKETLEYEQKVAVCAARAIAKLEADEFITWDPTEKADYELSVMVYRHQLRGDADNFHKAVSDGLNAIAYPDDRMIFSSLTLMTLDREHPRVEVTIRKWPYGAYSGADG